MNSGQDLMRELQSKVALLDKALQALSSRGRVWAQAEHDYKVELAKKILLERQGGTPVTILADVCRGDPSIAKARFNRDVAGVTYKAAMEAINCYKIELRLLENQIDREWNRT